MKIRSVLVGLTVLLIGIAVLFYLRWDAWFSNLPEPPYVVSSTPDHIILSLNENASSGRYVSWRCDSVPVEGYVELWNTSAGDTARIEAADTVVVSRAGKTAFYHAPLTGLEADIAYRYRVGNGEKKSSWHSFVIPAEKDSLTFIGFGDIQDSIGGNTGDIFKSIQARYPQVSFWAFDGDIIERPMDSYWCYWFGTMDGISQTVPVVAATGNHEYLKGVKKTLDSRWTSTFKNPANGPDGFEGRTYRVSFENLDFITLDTDGLQSPADYFRVRSWLSDILEQSDKKWKIVMMHHPVFSVRSGRDNPFIRWTFKPVFEKYKVDLVLEGHDHGYSRIASREKENNFTTPVYIDSNCSPKLYAIGFDKVHDRLGSNLNFYQYIKMKGDSLAVKVYTTDHELYDDILIVKDSREQVAVYDYAAAIPESLQLPEAYQGWKKEKRNKYEQEKQQRLLQRNY